MKSRIFSIVLSGLVAFGLWLYVVTVESPGSEKTYYNIPVALQNESVLEERGLMITSELPKVTLTLSGTRTNLNKMDENNINILVNAASIEAAGTHQLSYSVMYPGSVSNGDISRVGQSVNMITVTVEKRVIKNVEVVIEYTGNVPEGFIADKENTLKDYDTIKISGPESVVNQITQARIVVDLSNKTSTVMGAYSYQLCNKDGVPVDSKLITVNADKVNLTVKIQRMKEIPVSVEMIYGGGVTAANSSFTFAPTTIRVAGSEAQLADLNEIKLTVDMAKLLADKAQDSAGIVTMSNMTLKLPIELPEGVSIVSGEKEVTVEIAFNNVKVKKLTITQFVGDNANGKNYTVNSLTIVVGGTGSSIERITAQDIDAVVDFTNAQPNSWDYFPVSFVIAPNWMNVGVAGTYQASAILE